MHKVKSEKMSDNISETLKFINLQNVQSHIKEQHDPNGDFR